jgi:hypothetical protein
MYFDILHSFYLLSCLVFDFLWTIENISMLFLHLKSSHDALCLAQISSDDGINIPLNVVRRLNDHSRQCFEYLHERLHEMLLVTASRETMGERCILWMAVVIISCLRYQVVEVTPNVHTPSLRQKSSTLCVVSCTALCLEFGLAARALWFLWIIGQRPKDILFQLFVHMSETAG